MKRGFADTSELKTALGSQFQQYLAKVAIASGLADALDKLEHHKAQLPRGKACAGCGVPKKSISWVIKCLGCGVVERCNRPGCKGIPNIHNCVVCNKQNLCDGDKDFYYPCVRCNKAVCNDCETQCVGCLRTCIKCEPLIPKPAVRQWLSKEAQTLYESIFDTPEMLCIHCQIDTVQYESIMATCQQCNDEFVGGQTTKICKHLTCYNWVCSHDTTNGAEYCPDHQMERLKHQKME